MSATPAKRRRISRVLSADAREMIANCVHYVQQSSALRGNSYQLTAKMLGVANGTVSNVMKEFRELEKEQCTSDGDVKFVDREDTRTNQSQVSRSHENYVQSELFSMVEEEDLEELPTVRSIFQRIQDNKAERARALHVTAEEVWPFGQTTLWKVLGKLGYSFQADTDDRERQMLQPHVVDNKLYYLKRITHFRAANAVLLYVDETWVNKNHTKRKSWILDQSKAKDQSHKTKVLRRKGKKKPIGKGGRAIVIGIGSAETGTIPELLEIFKGKKSKKDPDYHSEMNARHFEEWWDSVLQYIEVHRHEWGDRPVCIIMDNASYHSRLTDDSKVPKTKWKKPDIIAYMQKEMIVPSSILPGYTPPEKVNLERLKAMEEGREYIYTPPVWDSATPPPAALYDKLTKKQLLLEIPSKPKKYVCDERAKAKNIQVLRLPPYHCDYNPIEMVWAYAKGQVAKKNVEYKLDDAMRIMREACLSCDAAYWVKLMGKIIREERQACAGNVLLRDIVERNAEQTIDDQLIVDLGSSSEEDSGDDAE